MDPAPSHGYDTQSGAQQVLRFVGKLYLGWYALSALAAVVFLAFYLLTGFDVTDFSSAVEPTREASLASGAVFFGRLGVQYRFGGRRIALRRSSQVRKAVSHPCDHPCYSKRRIMCS